MAMPTDGIEVEVVPALGGAATIEQPSSGGGGGGAPSGPAGGDLSGTYPTPSVAKVPSAALDAGTNVTVATTAGKAKVSVLTTAAVEVGSVGIGVAAGAAGSVKTTNSTLTDGAGNLTTGGQIQAGASGAKIWNSGAISGATYINGIAGTPNLIIGNNTNHVFLQCGQQVKVTVLAGTSTLSLTEFVLLVTSATASTITLPAAPPAGTCLVIKRVGAGAVTIKPSTATFNIDGHPSVPLGTRYESVMLVASGGNWYVVGQVATTIL